MPSPNDLASDPLVPVKIEFSQCAMSLGKSSAATGYETLFERGPGCGQIGFDAQHPFRELDALRAADLDHGNPPGEPGVALGTSRATIYRKIRGFGIIYRAPAVHSAPQ